MDLKSSRGLVRRGAEHTLQSLFHDYSSLVAKRISTASAADRTLLRRHSRAIGDGGRSKTRYVSYLRMSGPPTASAQPRRSNRQASCAQARFSSVAIHPTKVRTRSG